MLESQKPDFGNPEEDQMFKTAIDALERKIGKEQVIRDNAAGIAHRLREGEVIIKEHHWVNHLNPEGLEVRVPLGRNQRTERIRQYNNLRQLVSRIPPLPEDLLRTKA